MFEHKKPGETIKCPQGKINYKIGKNGPFRIPFSPIKLVRELG